MNPYAAGPGFPREAPSVYTSRGAEGDVVEGTPDIISNDSSMREKCDWVLTCHSHLRKGAVF